MLATHPHAVLADWGGGVLSLSELNSFLAKKARDKIDSDTKLHRLDQYAPSPKGSLYFPA